MGFMHGTFDIGRYSVGRVILAPMAGYTDIAFRELCIGFGAGLTVTEMVSVRGIKYNNRATEELMRLSPLETPSCIQLFGNTPDDFSYAADRIDCDIIDVNMGCPMPKITNNGDGSSLMKNPELAKSIVRAVADKGRTVTVKTRLGFDMGYNLADELVCAVIEGGASAVTVHGRYAAQRYAGESDYCSVKEICRKYKNSVPIILSGDVDRSNLAKSLEDFPAVMIGRAALSDPTVFGCESVGPADIARRHIELLAKYFDERYTVIQCRKFFVHYFNGRGVKKLRALVNSATSVDEIKRAIDCYEMGAL
ncbi:MAG: tRNA-dihydrouridine synthase [Clostridiales bacterium]|nr:tRNA-dihydrouridine synthase [Clostridiales bacterium]